MKPSSRSPAALLLLLFGAWGCGAAIPAQPSAEQKLERLKQRATALEREFQAAGFPLQGSEHLVDLGSFARDWNAVDVALGRDFPAGSPANADEALVTFRRLLGLKSSIEPWTLRRNLRVRALRSLSAYYDPLAQLAVFPDARLDPRINVDFLMAHVLAHAHQDQTQGGIDAFLTVNALSLDRALAARAVLEGQASLIARAVLMTRRGLTVRELDLSFEDDSFGELLAVEGSPLLRAAGEKLMWATYRKGGWEAVREVYRSAPQSSEQVLHPEKHPTDSPQIVTLPVWPVPTDKVIRIADTVLGELIIFESLAQALRTVGDVRLRWRDEAELAATGWDGDRFAVYQLADRRRAAMWRSVWDLEDAAREFARALIRALSLHQVPEANVSVNQRGLIVDVAFSEDPAELPKIAGALANHPWYFQTNEQDINTTIAARTELLRRISLRPRVEGSWWIHPASAVAVPVPKNWELELVGDLPVLLNQDDRHVISALSVPDLFDGDLKALRNNMEASIFSNPHLDEVDITMKTISGTEVAVLTLRNNNANPPVRVRLWAIPRSGHLLLLLAGLPDDEWPESRQLLADFERGFSIGAQGE